MLRPMILLENSVAIHNLHTRLTRFEIDNALILAALGTTRLSLVDLLLNERL